MYDVDGDPLWIKWYKICKRIMIVNNMKYIVNPWMNKLR